MRFDIAIAGGGPAGSACALSLRSLAPSLRVVQVESLQPERPRLAESLSPAAEQLLDQLGVSGASMLATEAERRGVTRMTRISVRDAERSRSGWRVMLSNGESLNARFLVDATGTASLATRACTAEIIAIDHLAGFGRFFDEGGDAGDFRTIVEPFADGWWYTAALPGGKRFAACMTDVDLAREMNLEDDDVWYALAAAMPVVGPLIARASQPGPLAGRGAESRYIEPAAGDDWLAVGDSAARFDPLSSPGIEHALRSGIVASHAIGDALLRGDASEIVRYRDFIRRTFASYLETRRKFYAEEPRWKEHEFWSRRISSSSFSPASGGEGAEGG
jgi:flavin-dependent dehydrogenase